MHASGFVVRRLIRRRTRRMLRRFFRQSKRRYRAGLRERKTFEAALYRKWIDGLSWLDIFMWFVYDETSGYVRRQSAQAVADGDVTFEALKRLHARSCQVTSEIAALLRTGHAEGAMARWRTLHEIAVTMRFLRQHGDDAATRYLAHPGAAQVARMIEYDRYAEVLHGNLFSTAAHDRAREIRDALVDRYGPEYPEPYGWAAAFVWRTRKGRRTAPTFAQIEQAVEMDHHRPWYRFASEGQHAGPHALRKPIANLSPDQVLVAGQSDVGLFEPGSGAAASLLDASLTLLAHRPDFQAVAVMAVLSSISEEVRDAFQRSYENIDYSVAPRVAR